MTEHSKHTLTEPADVANISLSEHYLQRFGGIARLYGEDALPVLASAHMLVAGIGGVGTWVAEALARSGVGELTLIDMDEVCVTNTNRQVHALKDTVGQSKIEVMHQRLLQINPEIRVNLIEDFLQMSNIADYLSPEHDVVIDAVDSAHVKAAMVAYCRARKIRLICVGSSGGKRDPTRVQCVDLGLTTSDPMLAKVRNLLYKKFNFAKDSKRRFGIDTVFSDEQMVYPKPDGQVCQQKSGLENGVKLDCASGFGSATMLTGTFGFTAAAKAVERLIEKKLGRQFVKKN